MPAPDMLALKHCQRACSQFLLCLQSVEAGRAAAHELQTKMGGARESQESAEMYVKVKEAVQKRVADTFVAPLTQVRLLRFAL